MKKYSILLILFLFSFSGMAQQSGKSQVEQLASLAKDFNLNSQKALELLQAFEYNKLRFQAAAKDTSLKPAVRQQLLSKLISERQAKIKAVLNPAQQEKLFTILQKEIASIEANKDQFKKTHLEEIRKPLSGAALKKHEEKEIIYTPIQ